MNESFRSDRAADEIDLACPYCGSMNSWPASGLEASGAIVPYCPGGGCEDLDDFPRRS